MDKKFVLVILILIAVVLVSGCSQTPTDDKTNKNDTMNEDTPTIKPKTDGTGLAEDLSGVQNLESELEDPGLNNLNDDFDSALKALK